MRRRLRRLVRILLVLAVLGALAYGAGYLVTEIPERRASDWGDRAAPAFERAATAMASAFEAWDEFGAESTAPRRRLARAQTFDQTRRILVPVYARTERALDRIEAEIATANESIDAAEPALADTPSPWLLAGTDPIERTGGAAELGADYIRRARRFLKSLAVFARYERRAVRLRRRTIEAEARHFPADPERLSLAQVRRRLSRTLRALERIDAEVSELTPHRDLVALYRFDRADRRFYIRYLEQALAAYGALDQARLDAANERLRRHNERERRRFAKLFARLRTSSGLERATDSLTERAGTVRGAIAAVAGDDG